MNRTVTLFDGTKTRIECDDSELKEVLDRVMVQPFIKDFECGWLAKGNAENRVKNYISYVGSLMIVKPSEYGIQSERGMRRARAAEKKAIADSTVLKPKKQNKHETRFSRMEKLKAEHPNAHLVWVKVNTDGGFQYKGKRWRVTDVAYSPVKHRELGMYYKFDALLIMDDGKLAFYDQDIQPIALSQIKAA